MGLFPTLCMLLISLHFPSDMFDSQEVSESCEMTEKLEEFDHGDVLHQMRDDQVQLIDYTCHSGYQLKGPKEIACINGTWTPSEPPTCLLVDKMGNLKNDSKLAFR